MQWEIGLGGLALLAAFTVGSGLVAALLVGGGWSRRIWAAVITTVVGYGAGLLMSEWVFGGATEDEIQPIIDGLARDEIMLSSLLTTIAVVVVMRRLAHRHEPERGGRHLVGQHVRHRAGHA